MFRLRKLILSFLLALSAFGAIKHQAVPIWGPHYGYRGYSVYLFIRQGWFDSYSFTANTTTHQIEAPGSAFAASSAVYFFPQTGGALPNVLNGTIAYTVCPQSAGNYKVIVEGVAGCVNTNMLVNFGQTGSGDIEVGQLASSGVPSGNAELRSWVLPTGVTVGACLINGRVPCQNVGGNYSVSSASGTISIRLDVSSSATIGTSDIEVTLQNSLGATSAFQNKTLSFSFEVKDLVPLVITKPATYPTIPSLATWESKMLTVAGTYCNKATGEIDPEALPELQFSSSGEQQIWYYDGAWFYYQVADYTGDTDWRRCGDSISTWFAGVMRGNNGQYSQVWRNFTDGLKRSNSDWTMDGQNAIKLMWENNINNFGQSGGVGFGTAGDMSPIGLRPQSYAVGNGIAYARAVLRLQYWQSVPAGDFRNYMQRAVDQLLSQIAAQSEISNYNSLQVWMFGLALRDAIQWYEFSGDPRVPVEVKKAVDFIKDNGYNGNVSFPNELAYWMGGGVEPIIVGGEEFGTQGPNCPNRCNPFPMTLLTPQVNSAFAWVWSITGNYNYQTIGDALFTTAAGYTPTRGKEASEYFRDAFNYVWIRQGRQRAKP